MYFSWKLTSSHNPRIRYACYEGYVCPEAVCVCVCVDEVDRQTDDWGTPVNHVRLTLEMLSNLND